MPLAEHSLQDLHRFLVQRRRFLELALRLQRDREVLQMHADLRMIVAERLPIDVQRRAIQRRGAVLPAAIGIQAGQLVHHRGRVGRALLAVRAIDLQALVEQALRRVGVAAQLRELRLRHQRRRDFERSPDRAARAACRAPQSGAASHCARSPRSHNASPSARNATAPRRVSRPVDGDLRLQPFFQQRDRVRVQTETLVHACRSCRAASRASPADRRARG